MRKVLQYEDKLSRKLMWKVKQVHKKKFGCLVNLQKRELGIRFNSKWFVNKTGLDIPIDVQWVLSLEQKHALPVSRDEFPVMKVISDGEELVKTIGNTDEQEMASSHLVNVIDSHMNKMKLDNRNRYTIGKVKSCEKFLRQNRDILVMKADKGNTTVAINKVDYISRINDILGEATTYEILNRDPSSRLQKMNNNFVDELFRLNIVSLLEKNNLKTHVAVAPKLYGLPKIHKEGFPLRPICSSINSPSYGLCKYITSILHRLTVDSKYNVRNSLEFRDRI